MKNITDAEWQHSSVVKRLTDDDVRLQKKVERSGDISSTRNININTKIITSTTYFKKRRRGIIYTLHKLPWN